MRSTLFIIAAVLILVTGCQPQECTEELNILVDNEQLEKDKTAINNYLEQNNIEASTHPSGVRYVISKEGEGDRPDLCSSVRVVYEGRRMSDGVRFDGTSDPVLFGLNSLIKGWQIGIPLITEGGRITLYIPSVYAYGKKGGGSKIPANENLIFEITLVETR